MFDSVVFVNRIKKMVGFQLSKGMEKDVFHLVCVLSELRSRVETD